jgi:hypothetical protein
MEGAFAVARVCPKPGCSRALVPTMHAPARPDYWVRKPAAGRGWWYTFTPPVAPREEPGRIAYVCPTCGQTFRLVDAVVEESPGVEAPSVQTRRA